jgi:hypothetical protein
MPQPPTPDCYFCSGTGTVLAERVSAVVFPGRCLCTVASEEIAAAIPGLIDSILKRIDQKDIT